MENYLVVGVETVVGANLTAYLTEHAQHAHITGLSCGEPVTIAGCSVAIAGAVGLEEARRWCRETAATQVILCGGAARSSWEPEAARIDRSLSDWTAAWSRAAQGAQARLTVISSDAVFTGPWLFHEEEGGGLCDSPEARLIREAEHQALTLHPQPLVVRTNVFGWSPRGAQGWVEQRLQELRTRRLADQDFIRHATPILATDLAGILVRAWSEGLQGLYHIGGAERVSPLKFVQRLAEHYHLPWLTIRRAESLQERAIGFGQGECSLQTKRLRKALCVAMPMLSEGLSRLVAQDLSGFRQRLCPQTSRGVDRAA